MEALVVAATREPELPPADGRHRWPRLELPRDRAIPTTLYATAMRRAELARLNHADIQDGRASEGLVTGKGEKERVVFSDEEPLAAIRVYLRARRRLYAPLHALRRRAWPARLHGEQ